MESRKLLVKTKSKKYPIFIGEKSFDELNKIISDSSNKILTIIDENVSKKCSDVVNQIFRKPKSNFEFIINCSEKRKSVRTVEKICKYIVENRFDKNSLLISIGGGVLGDIVGFTASIFMRGIKYIQVPTTILSAIDSSIGGKTAVNFNGVKNLIGTFYQPESVFINPKFFNTLPELEVFSGLGELVKYALIVPDKYYFFREEVKKIFYEKNVSEKVITTSLKIKSQIVNKDEKEETGLRKILNLGHTFAHGFESASNYKLKHGEAVYYGVISALFVSRDLGIVSQNKVDNFLEDFRFMKIRKLFCSLDTQDVIKFMKSDKKNRGESINLVLPTQNEIILDYPVEEKYIINVIEKVKRLCD
jgi:3-dehydroquinate synthase/shikimate kinase/3-dehydroquinate synthase